MQIGMQLAEILSGSWRQRNPMLSSEDLHRHAPLLAASGGAALVWFGIRRHRAKFSESALNLYREAYLGSTAGAAAHEVELERLARAFNAATIRSILLKGWSVGRFYPESGLRPSGDIDLWIDPAQRAQAGEVLKRVVSGRQSVDLEHDQFHRFENRRFDDFTRPAIPCTWDRHRSRFYGAKIRLELYASISLSMEGGGRSGCATSRSC